MKGVRRAMLTGLIASVLVVVLAVPAVASVMPTASTVIAPTPVHVQAPSVLVERSTGPGGAVPPPVSSESLAPAVALSVAPSSPAVEAASPVVLSGWDALHYGTDSGISNGWVPPDVQVAGGPNHVVEMVNLLMGIYTKTGTQVSVTALSSFFNSGSDFISDPKVQYDSVSGRWFASVTDVTTSAIRLAVSASSDPTSTWTKYVFTGTGCLDQPILGVGTWTAILSVNVFSSCTTSGKYVGASYWVVNKTDLVSGAASPRSFVQPANANDFSLHPVQVLGTSSVHYLVATSWPGALVTSNVLQLITVSGVPPVVPVITEKDLPIPVASLAPSSPQLGTSATVDSGDIRVSDAVYADGRIWLGFSASCLPAGDTTNRSCARMIQVDASTGTILQDFSIGLANKYLYYPAMRTDSMGNLAVVVGYSSSTDYPGVMATGQVYAGPLNTFQPPQTVRAGTGPEDPSRCSGVCRYGDYFGAGLDPSDSTTVWLAGEFGTASGWSTRVFGARIKAMLTLSYGVRGGGTGYAAPTLSYTLNGSTTGVALGGSPTTYLADPGTAWTVTATLGGSSGTERWAVPANGTPPLEGVADRSLTANYTYYHQYSLTFTSTVLGGGSPSAPQVDFTSFGLQGWAPTNHPYWVDAGTDYAYRDPLDGSTATERWYAPQSGAGTATGPGTVSMQYYHQFSVLFTYTVLGGTGYGAPTIAITRYGANGTVTAPTTTWVDAGGPYAYSASLPGSTDTLRWGAVANATGAITASTTIVVPYRVQYLVTVMANPAGAGALLTGGGWYDANATATLTATSNASWQFRGWIGSGPGGVSGSNTTALFRVTGPVTETASFYPGLTIEAGPGGSVSYSYGSVSGTVPAGSSVTLYVPVGTTLTLTATPSSWTYAFDGWSGAVSGSGGTIAVTVSAPGRAVADFGASTALLVIPMVVVIAVVLLVLILFLSRRKRKEPPT